MPTAMGGRQKIMVQRNKDIALHANFRKLSLICSSIGRGAVATALQLLGRAVVATWAALSCICLLSFVGFVTQTDFSAIFGR